MGFGVTLFCVGVSAVAGLLLPVSVGGAAESQVGAALLTTAEVLSGVAGLLFAAIIFGVQFHGERLGRASFLVEYLPRREGIVPIAAFVLAVIAAHLLVGLLVARSLPAAASVMATLDVLLLPIVFLVTLWLICRLIAGASADFFEQSLKPGLAWDLHRALDEDVHRAALVAAYGETLSTLGMEHEIGLGLLHARRDATEVFLLSHRGEIRDINVDALHTLAELLHRVCPDRAVALTVAPYDTVKADPVVVLTARRDENLRAVSVNPLSADARASLQSAIDRVFLLTVPRERVVVELLHKFQDLMVDYARYDQPGQLRRAIDVYEHLITQSIHRECAEPRRWSPTFRAVPDFVYGLAYGKLAESVVAAGDREKIDSVLGLAVGLMQLGIKRSDAVLFRHAADLAAGIYHYGHQRADLQVWIGYTFDMWMHHVLENFHARRRAYSADSTPESIEAQAPVLRAALSWVLELLKMAIEADRQQDAEDFLERLFEFDRYGEMRGARRERDDLPESVRAAIDLHTYALMAVAGWCLYLVRDCGRKTETVKSSFRHCVIACGTRQDVVMAWERIRSGADVCSPVDAELGVERWSEPERRWRSGVVRHSLSASQWLPNGFVALAIVRRPAREYELPEGMGRPAPMGYDVGRLEQLANQLVDDQYVRDELLELDQDDATRARAEFIALISERVCLTKREWLTQVHDAPISAKRRDEIRESIVENVESSRSLLRVLEHMGALESVATAQPAWARVQVQVPKTTYVDCDGGAFNHGELRAEDIGREETADLTRNLENQADTIGTIQTLDDVQPLVRAAIAELRSRGYTPTVILLPDLPHVVGVMVQSHWLGDIADIGREGCSEFDGITAVRFPYGYAASITVADIGAFFGKTEAPRSGDAITLEVTDAYAVDNEGLCEAAKHANDPSKISDAHKLRVLVEVRMPLGANVRDRNAAVRVDLNQSTLGFAIAGEEALYHRPDCPDIVGQPGVEYIADVRAAMDVGRRNACPKCSPDDWGEEDG